MDSQHRHFNRFFIIVNPFICQNFQNLKDVQCINLHLRINIGHTQVKIRTIKTNPYFPFNHSIMLFLPFDVGVEQHKVRNTLQQDVVNRRRHSWLPIKQL